MSNVIVGVDVGGTNTDAVVLCGRNVISCAKTATTSDVTSGVRRAISQALNKAHLPLKGKTCVSRIHIGTTHFVNAVVQRRELARVAVVRLCGKATRSLPPYGDFPADLKEVVNGGVYLVDGGYQYDGQEEIAPLRPEQLREVGRAIHQDGVQHVVVSAIFSPINEQHEKQAWALLREVAPSLSVTLSHSVGQLGLLERENAAILNESLRPLSRRTVTAFREALDHLGLTCPFYLSQNDGTLLSAEQALYLPVHTFASGPTNSMRGATFLSGVKDAVVVDVGGTTADVGVITTGFPRQAGVRAKVGGVATNFRMPDVLSIGLGGGTIVKTDDKSPSNCRIGPESVGYRLKREALVFGGQTLTGTDIAVAAGLADIGQKERVAHLDKELVRTAQRTIHDMLENAIDEVKVSSGDVVAVLVGGGSVLIDPSVSMKGISSIVKPPSFEVANAVGAALSQVSGYVDHTVSLENTSREEAKARAVQEANQRAAALGADPRTIQVVEVSEVPLTYLPGNVTRVKVKVVGDLLEDENVEVVQWVPTEDQEEGEEEGVAQVSSSTGGSLDPAEDGQDHFAAALQETEPRVDAESGEWVLSGWDVECIAVGAGILGCGGGGSPNVGRLRAHVALNAGKSMRVIHPERLKSQMQEGDCVLPLAIMGSPVICIERVPSDVEALNAMQAIEDLYNCGLYDDETGVMCNQEDIQVEENITYLDNFQPPPVGGGGAGSSSRPRRRVVALVSAEIGGLNSIEPLLLGAATGLPVVDCDGMGRAFPELQMFTPFIYGHKPFPGTLSDHSGRKAVVLKTDTPKHLEDHLRQVCCQNMGCMGAFVGRALEKDDLTPKLVQYSMSRAWRLGQAVLSARRRKASPVQAIIDHEGASLLATGKVVDVERVTAGGFARGLLSLEGLGKYAGQNYTVKFQNENLVASLVLPDGRHKVLACTPDLLALVSTDSGQPVTTEDVRYGLRVSLLAVPAVPELTTPQAIQVVGPQAFGYSPEEVTYRPVGTYVQKPPIPRA